MESWGSESWGRDRPDKGNGMCKSTGLKRQDMVGAGGMFSVAGE